MAPRIINKNKYNFKTFFKIPQGRWLLERKRLCVPQGSSPPSLEADSGRAAPAEVIAAERGAAPRRSLLRAGDPGVAEDAGRTLSLCSASSLRGA